MTVVFTRISSELSVTRVAGFVSWCCHRHVVIASTRWRTHFDKLQLKSSIFEENCCVTHIQRLQSLLFVSLLTTPMLFTSLHCYGGNTYPPAHASTEEEGMCHAMPQRRTCVMLCYTKAGRTSNVPVQLVHGHPRTDPLAVRVCGSATPGLDMRPRVLVASRARGSRVIEKCVGLRGQEGICEMLCFVKLSLLNARNVFASYINHKNI